MNGTHLIDTYAMDLILWCCQRCESRAEKTKKKLTTMRESLVILSRD